MNKNEYRKISDQCGIASIQEWGNKNGEWWYVVYVQTSHWDNEGVGEVFGKGKTIEEALIQAVKNLVFCGRKALPFSYLKDIDIRDFIETLQEEKGCIGELEPPVLPIESTCMTSLPPEKVRGNPSLEAEAGYFISNTHVIIDPRDDKAYAFST
jgi:hypothetical protein